jgi:hypothetical protein
MDLGLGQQPVAQRHQTAADPGHVKLGWSAQPCKGRRRPALPEQRLLLPLAGQRLGRGSVAAWGRTTVAQPRACRRRGRTRGC